MAELLFGIIGILSFLVGAFFYFKKPAFKTWKSVFDGFETSVTPRKTEKIYGRLYAEKLVFRSLVGASSDGVVIFNELAPYFDKILLPWSSISVVEFHSSRELAKILFTKSNKESQEVVLPWLPAFSKYVPSKVGFVEI